MAILALHHVQLAMPRGREADARALAERCRSHGAPVTAGAPLAGYRRLDVADPFGNRIELLEATGGEDAAGPAGGDAGVP